MVEHLPECYKEGSTDACICDELRACEQRVTERWESLRGWGETYAYKTGSDNGFSSGYAAGLDAARAAVVAVEENPKAEVDYERDYTADSSGETRNPRIWVREAVAAIEAIDDTRQANQHQTLDPHEGERHE